MNFSSISTSESLHTFIAIILYFLLMGVLSIPFWIALFRAAKLKQTPGLVPSIYILLLITYIFAIIHIDALLLFGLPIAYLGTAALFIEAYFYRLDWALLSAAAIFMVSLFLISKSRGIWRIRICFPLAALLFYVPIQLQSWASTQQIISQANTMQFDSYEIRPFWDSMAYSRMYFTPYHGRAYRGSEIYIWSYRARAWLPE